MQAEETPYWCGHDAHVPGDCPWAAEETPGLSEARIVTEHPWYGWFPTEFNAPWQTCCGVPRQFHIPKEVADEARRPLLDALGKVERDLKAIVPHSDPLAPWWYKERVEEVVQKLIRLRNLGEAYVEHAPKPPRWAYEEPAERALGGDSGVQL